MRKCIAVFCVLSLLALVACGCEANRPEQLIAGRWEAENSAQFQAMEFSPHGGDMQRGQVHLSMMGKEINGKYKIVPDEEQHRMTITYTLMMFPATRVFLFTLEGDALVLQEENSAVSVDYRRVDAE